jgi:spermidine synthase
MKPQRASFLTGVFLITFAVLVFQVVQTRILSVIAWYYLAFLAISVAMLGMTAGAVWVYSRRERLTPEALSTMLSDTSLLAAVSMPASVLVQFSLITTVTPTFTSVFGWSLLMAAMTVPYVFAGITVSLALTRSPFPVSLVYGVDLLGAALGCAAVIGILNLMDGPTAILFAGFVAALAALVFARGATPSERQSLLSRALWRRPIVAAIALALLIVVNRNTEYGFKPVMVKDRIETGQRTRTERWNSYSRIVAYRPNEAAADLWAPSPTMPTGMRRQQAFLNIDGAAGTVMFQFDGTRESIDFLKYDLVNLAYHLPGIEKSAVIGVGGGRDLLSAHLFGVKDITGVELNRIFIDFHTRDPFYSAFSNLKSLPGLKLEVDDARSWFAATDQSFDLIQMSLIDTWAATGAGAFSLSENGLYTLEGWRAFTRRLTGNGVFTVSRWYNPGDVNESGRMIALALATMMDAGAADARAHVFVARGREIATLVLSKSAFTAQQLDLLRAATTRLGFDVLVDPGAEPSSAVLRAMVHARNRIELDRAASTEALDLTVSTDNRPFFFNQLRFRHIPSMLSAMARNEVPQGVLRGNLVATIVLVLILAIAAIAVVCTIVLPLRGAARSASPALIGAGTVYFALIGIGFMFAEISLLQYFGIFLGHPIYAMGVCLFSLILSTGIGSLVSGSFSLNTKSRITVWGLLVGVSLIAAQFILPEIFAIATAGALPVRIAIALAVVMPVGFLMGFAFPTGMMLIERIDRAPAPWFWGINGATGVLASVAAVMIGMAFGINVTMILAGVCYLALIPVALRLSQLPSPA